MSPAPFAVLVLPYTIDLDGEVSFAVLRDVSACDRAWHAIAGDGGCGEIPVHAARRLALSTAGIALDAPVIALDSRAWVYSAEALEVPEFAFGVRVLPDEVRPTCGHLEHRWLSYDIAQGLLCPEAHLNALWELRRRLGRPTPML